MTRLVRKVGHKPNDVRENRRGMGPPVDWGEAKISVSGSAHELIRV